ncbi:AMP-binding protein [Pseudonocardia sp.]|uniref:AMP-binding protein n=1 Tax=Pseudonocardia sp. TaxID=60912 RepID=UPI003D13286A
MSAPAHRALVDPGRPAVVGAGSSRQPTCGQLDERSRSLAAWFAEVGLRHGDHIALVLPDRVDYLVAAWAARRAGLHYTPVDVHLTATELRYVIEECGAAVVVGSAGLIALFDVSTGRVLWWTFDDPATTGWERPTGAACGDLGPGARRV